MSDEEDDFQGVEPEGDEDVINWDDAVDEIVGVPRRLFVGGDGDGAWVWPQGDGEWPFVLDMVAELYSSVVQHAKGALRGMIAYNALENPAEAPWDDLLDRTCVRVSPLLALSSLGLLTCEALLMFPLPLFVFTGNPPCSAHTEGCVSTGVLCGPG